jgi:hypothetical protein
MRTALLTAAVAAVVLIFTPAAKADTPEQQYLDAAVNAGYFNVGGNWAMLTVGRSACNDLMLGYPRPTVVNNLFFASRMTFQASDGLVGLAQAYLCPFTSTFTPLQPAI